MPRLILKDSNRFLGVISDADVKVSILEGAGASSTLVELLGAIGDSDGIDVRWEK